MNRPSLAHKTQTDNPAGALFHPNTTQASLLLKLLAPQAAKVALPGTAPFWQVPCCQAQPAGFHSCPTSLVRPIASEGAVPRLFIFSAGPLGARGRERRRHAVRRCSGRPGAPEDLLAARRRSHAYFRMEPLKSVTAD